MRCKCPDCGRLIVGWWPSDDFTPLCQECGERVMRQQLHARVQQLEAENGELKAKKNTR